MTVQFHYNGDNSDKIFYYWFVDSHNLIENQIYKFQCKKMAFKAVQNYN